MPKPVAPAKGRARERGLLEVPNDPFVSFTNPGMGTAEGLEGSPPATPGDSQGNSGWKGAHPGPGVTNRGAYPCKGSKDPTPGGGW